MSWEAIGALGEVVGAAAVVISLVYLAGQVRANTNAMKASASFDATHSWATFAEMIAQSIYADPAFQRGEESALARMAAKVYDRNSSPEDFTDTERVALGLSHRAIFQKLEGPYFLYRHGYMDAELWTERRDWARGFVELPAVRDWWSTELTQSIYSPSFVRELEGGKPTSVRMTGLEPSPSESDRVPPPPAAT